MSSRIFLSAILLVASALHAGNYAALRWHDLETPHFVIHYHEGVEWTAQKVAQVAEEIYPKVTAIYKHEPAGRTHIIVRDDEDTSNGFAVYNLGYITIWASPSSLLLRGRHDWIRGVVTHEFSHVVSLQASSGAGWLVEGIRFGGINNADTKYNSDIGGTAFVLTQPAHRWWAEGTAQVDTASAGYAPWDSVQDALLRSSVLEGNLLTFDEMRNISSRERFGGELVYNQGFAFLRWLNKTYGADANARLAGNAADRWHLDFDRNFPHTVGKDARTLYDEWKKEITESYQKQVAEIRKSPVDGTRISLLSQKEVEKASPDDRPYADGAYNAYPRFSPDGQWFAWVSRNTVRLVRLDEPFDLRTLDRESDETNPKPDSLRVDFTGRYFSFSPDSTRVVISRRRTDVWGEYPYFDLSVADLTPLIRLHDEYRKKFQAAAQPSQRKGITRSFHSRKESLEPSPKRISRKLRATHPAWSPDGKKIAFSRNRDGRRSLEVMNSDGTGLQTLVAIAGDAEALDAAWSPDGKKIAFTLFNHDQSDIWVVDAEGGAPKPITFDSADDREPAFTPDGKEIFFSSDRSGIFQIYRTSAEGMAPGQEVTRVETGAFMPNVSPNGSELLYVRFSSYGFKPYRLTLASSTAPEAAGAPPADSNKQLTAETLAPAPASKTSFPWPRPARFFPSLVWENDQFKAGIGVQVSDYLERHSLTALGLFGEDQDYQVTYTNRMLPSTLSASYTSYIRNNTFPILNSVPDPKGNLRDNIQFVEAGFSQPLETYDILPGDHTLTLAYDRRFVDRRIGFPLTVNGETVTSFRFLTNDGLTAGWGYRKEPGVPPRDFDINPRDLTTVEVTYSFVHTELAFNDTTIPGPNRDYLYHEGTLEASHYFPVRSYDSVWFRFIGGMKSRDVNANDEFFLGGRLNFRAFGQISSNTLFYGYEDFSIAGETMLLLSTGYTLPIVRAIDKKTGLLYWDGLYGCLFGEIGNAWSFGEFENLRQNPTHDPTLGDGTILLEDIGAELKLKAFLFNDFNRFNSVFRVSYGFQDDAAHGFSDSDWPVRFYIGIGTDF